MAPRLVWRRAPPVLRLALAAFPLLSQLLRPEEEGVPCCPCVPIGYSQQAPLGTHTTHLTLCINTDQSKKGCS